jgi:hypothetical protein
MVPFPCRSNLHWRYCYHCLKRIFNLICMIDEFLALFQDIGFSAIHIFLNEDPKGKVDHHSSIFSNIFIYIYNIIFTMWVSRVPLWLLLEWLWALREWAEWDYDYSLSVQSETQNIPWVSRVRLWLLLECAGWDFEYSLSVTVQVETLNTPWVCRVRLWTLLECAEWDTDYSLNVQSETLNTL